MLRMTQLRSAGAKDYFSNDLSNPGYYTDGRELRATFCGRMAQRIGIEGPVTKFAFNALCENLNPLTLKLLTQRKSKVRTSAYDLTFCCPKSVSLAHVFSGDDHVLQAFHTAVHDTMKEIEADAKTRVRKNGKDEDRLTGELLYADFIHQTARGTNGNTPDPFLHCHVVVFNATHDPIEQQIKAAQFRDIMRDMPYYEAIFYKKLADNLRNQGYRIRPTKTSFELIGINPVLIDAFSKRKNEIEQFAKEHNITDPNELGKLGAKTRAKKEKGLSIDALKVEWKNQIHALGLHTSFEHIRFANDNPQSILTPVQCVDHALHHHLERQSTVQDRRILAKAYKFGIADSVTLDQIDHAFKTHQNIITVKEKGRQLCTTTTVLQSETHMIALAHEGKGMFAPLYSAPPAMKLKGEQADATCHILTTNNQLSVILGSAGTGKTTLMQEAVALIREVGKDVIAVAPTAQARDILRKEGFENAETVAKLLISPTLQSKLKDQVLWVDEAGLLGLKDMTALLEIARKQNTRIILGGDYFQNNSVSLGDSLRLIVTSGIPSMRVNKIYRQRKIEYRDAVQDLAQGNVGAAFSKIDKMGAIKVFEDNYQSLAKDYMATISKGKTALIVSPTHAEGAAVTATVRNALRDAGMIGKQETALPRLINLNLTEAEKTDGRFYEAGQVLQINQNCRDIACRDAVTVVQVAGNRLTLVDEKRKTFEVSLQDMQGVEVYRKASLNLSEGDAIRITRNGFDENKQSLNNGQLLKVVEINKNTITACHADGKTEYHLPVSFGHLAHAYCMTSHASQGQTVDEVFIAQNTSIPAGASLKQFYVSCSRGRDRLHVYTDNKKALLTQVMRSGNRIGAIELMYKRELF